MISLMAYAMLVTALLGLAALFAEKIFAELGWSRRGIWLVTLVTSLAMPIYALVAPTPVVDAERGALPFSLDFVPVDVPAQIAIAFSGAISDSWLKMPEWENLDRVLAVFWVLASALTVLTCVLGAMSLQRSLRKAKTITLADQEVVLSDRLGPAVVGFLRPRIVLPRWIASADTELRTLVLRHEQEHITAHDQLILLGALLLVAGMPWNPALWWQLRRLRAAIEVDCDARVLRSGANRLGYAEALLQVRQRGSSVPLGAVALIQPPSQLEQRIRIMLVKARNFSVSRTGFRTFLVLSLIAVVFMTEAPLAQQPTGDREPAAAPSRPGNSVRTNVFDRLLEAQTCLEAGDLACARERLAEVREMDLSDYELAQYWYFKGYADFTEGDVEAATAAYESVLGLPDIPEGLREATLWAVGSIYATTGQHQKAFETREEILSLRGIEPAPDQLPAVTDSEYLPIVTVAPTYPPRAAARGIEGYVVVEYTVDETGSTTDVRVVESSTTLFEAAAIESVRKFRYEPRIVNGQPVVVPGVRSRIEFRLEHGSDGDAEPEA